ncbi:hypothetical protein AAG570_003746 [Ranatra chinensis]|uniref:Uncharacterized protein n=1 Tax=Ranatra chinensis TaxID=642074 RepID=A0ABD0Y4I6_9HEMI
MTLYLPPPKKEKGKDFIMGMKEDWLQRANMCIEDFEWLLGLSHHRFWSQFVFQRSCDGLVSFLQEAYPFYALDQLPDDGEVKSVYNRIVALAFSLLVRLTMRIESPTEWIGEKKYASIIYNKFLISIPMLLDICVIYGPTNEAEIRRMTEQVFTVQPCYRDDLVKCIEDVKNVYYQSVNKVAGSCGHLVDFVKGNVKNESINITLPEVDDVLFFLMDVTISLSTFADMYTDAATIMHQQHLEAVEELTSQAISTFADGYMTVMLETLSEKEFMKDYNIVFPLCADIELLNQVCPEVETDHLLNSVMSFYEDFEKWTKSEAPDNCAAGGQQPLPSTSSNERKVVTGVELESLITEVKDILPHLGEGFIQFQLVWNPLDDKFFFWMTMFREKRIQVKKREWVGLQELLV